MRTTSQVATRLLNRLQPSGGWVLGATAVMLGVLTGLGVWLFKALIALIHSVAFDRFGAAMAAHAGWLLALVPVAGGLLVGIAWRIFVRRDRFHGVAGIMEATAVNGGRLEGRLLPAKTITSALAIGAGASVGPEDPSVQIGANVGSVFGQWLRLSDERVRSLVGAGAAAGISAAFNSPIAGIFFGLEVVLGEFASGTLGVVVLASVTASVFTQAVAGPEPAFTVPAYAFHSVRELPFYLGLGAIAGPVATAYIAAVYRAHDFFHHWRFPSWLKPAAAGLAVGLTGLALPQVLGVGYDTIEQFLRGAREPVLLLALLLLAKLVMTAVSVGGGFPGGLFAPSLFLGATLGTGYALALKAGYPGFALDVPAFALVGMAAVLAATVHAPLTAILLIFEMTRDYRILLPLMLAVVVALVIEERILGHSIYTLGLARRGIKLERGRDVEILDSITVGMVMREDTSTLAEDDTLAAASERFSRSRHHGLPVLDNDGLLAGICTIQDVETALSRDAGEQTPVSAFCTREVQVAYRDESLATALRRMGTRDIGRLPVVTRADPRRLIGILRRADIVRAYNLAVASRVPARRRLREISADEMHRLSFEDLTVADGSPVAGRLVSVVPWPREAVIVTVRRRGQLLIPHGNTVLEPGDVLAVVMRSAARTEMARLVGAQSQAERQAPIAQLVSGSSIAPVVPKVADSDGRAGSESREAGRLGSGSQERTRTSGSEREPNDD